MMHHQLLNMRWRPEQKIGLVIAAGAVVFYCGCYPQDNSSHPINPPLVKATPAKPEVDVWVPIESKEGNFKVMFPQIPKHKTSENSPSQTYSLAYEEGRRLLRVNYEHNHQSSIEIAARFEEVQKRSDILGPLKTTMITLGEHPGMEATYGVEEDGRILLCKHRIYQVGSSSYQLIAMWEQGDASEDDVERFFSSFQLLSP